MIQIIRHQGMQDKHKTEKGVNSERRKERKSQGKRKTSQGGEEEAPERGKEGRKNTRGRRQQSFNFINSS